MKKTYIVGIIVVILIVAGLIIGGVFDKSGSKIPDISHDNDTTNAPLTLTTIRADVFAEINGDKNGVLVASSSVLSQNDAVKTGVSGRALLENTDFKTTIDHDTEISIKEVKEKQANLALNSGSVWLRVQKVFGKGEGVEVETPNAVAAVRGTSFGLMYINEITTLIVNEGTVGFRAIGSSTAEETLVNVGMKAVIGKDGKIVITAFTDKDKNSEWFKYNNLDSQSTESTSGDPSGSSSGNTGNTGSTTAPPATSPTSGGSGGSGGGTSQNSTPPANPNEGCRSGTVSPNAAGIQAVGISPCKVLVASPTSVTISGKGFMMAKQVLVGNFNFPFRIINDSTILFTASELSPNVYDITVSGGNYSSTLSQILVITGDTT